MASNKKKSKSASQSKSKPTVKKKTAAKPPKKAVRSAKKPSKAVSSSAGLKTKTATKGKTAVKATSRKSGSAPSAARASAKPAPKGAKPAHSAKKTPAISGFVPVRDHILVQPDGFSEKTPGGLFIPATVKDKPLQGRVLAVGKGAFNKKGLLRPLDVQVGEKVLYTQYAGTTVTLQGQELLILKEDDVLGVSKD